MTDIFWKRGQGRAFIQPYRNPSHNNVYLGCARVGGYTKSRGDLTPVYCPSPERYGQYEVVDVIRGEGGLPTTSVDARFGLVNEILEQECDFDLDVHYGRCADPTDFNRGWEKIIKFERSGITEESSDELSSLEPTDEALIMLTASITSWTRIFIERMTYAERAASETDTPVLAVAICDDLSCGECGWESGGCRRLLAATAAVAGSPYDLPELLESLDKGLNWNEWDIDTLHDADVSGMACVGSRVAVVSAGSTGLHYASLSDLDSWTEVPNVFQVGALPLAIFAFSPTQIWIVGQNGYVYFTDDITSAAAYEVQDAGAAAAGDDLLDVHAATSRNVVAVGELGTVVVTTNGGLTWAVAASSPTASDIHCIWMRTPYHWLVGSADGNLYYTLNAAVAWVQKEFPDDGSGHVLDLVFYGYTNSSVGYMVYAYDPTGTPPSATSDGRILRTLDNGNSWYVVPEEEASSVPDNLALTELAVCRDPNFVLAGGYRTLADGIVVVGEG